VGVGVGVGVGVSVSVSVVVCGWVGVGVGVGACVPLVHGSTWQCCCVCVCCDAARDNRVGSTAITKHMVDTARGSVAVCVSAVTQHVAAMSAAVFCI